MLKPSYVLCLAVLLGGCASVVDPLPPDGQPPGPARRAGTPDIKSMRMRVAAAVEGHVAFRTLLDGGAPRLLNPRIAGPLQNPPHRGQYCVSIQFGTYMARTAIVSEQASPDGSTVMNVGLHDA